MPRVRWARIERVVAFVFLLTLPLQTRLFLFGPTSPADVAQGAVFYEWLSGFLYVSDIALLVLLAVWGMRILRKEATVPFDKITLLVALGIASACATTLWALNTDVALYRNIKLLEGFALFLWARQTNMSTNLFAAAFVVGGVFQALVASAQFLLQRSLGLAWLAESPLSALDSEVAKFVASSGRFIRAYGTLPSPNVLAFFLVLALLFAIFLYLRKQLAAPWFALISFPLLLGLSFTFSRGLVAIGAVSVVVLLALSLKEQRIRSTVAILVACTLAAFLPVAGEWYERAFVTVRSDYAVSERVQLNETALYGIAQTPWGVGTGTFTAIHHTLDQPIHNMFLLAAVESGPTFAFVLAALLFYALYTQLKTKNPERMLWVPILVLFIGAGMIDHFLLTLQQGMLAFWVVGGLLSRKIASTVDKKWEF